MCYMEKMQPQPVVLCKMCTLKAHRVQWILENECFSSSCSQPEFIDFVMAEFQKPVQFCKINVMFKAIKLFPFLECWSTSLKLYFSIMASLEFADILSWAPESSSFWYSPISHKFTYSGLESPCEYTKLQTFLVVAKTARNVDHSKSSLPFRSTWRSHSETDLCPIKIGLKTYLVLRPIDFMCNWKP